VPKNLRTTEVEKRAEYGKATEAEELAAASKNPAEAERAV
jgi:hypothetical protein